MLSNPPWRDYEDFVEQWAGGLVGDSATIERNVKMPGRRSGVARQVDPRITGVFAGAAVGPVTAVLNSKLRRRNLDVTAVGAFADLVDDVGADIGVLVTNRGFSVAAQQLAQERRIRLHV